MKKLILAGICLAIIGGIVANTFGEQLEQLFSTTYVVDNSTTEKEIKVERVVEKELDVRIAEALERELPAIEEEAQRMLTEAEAKAKAEYEAALALAASTSQKYIAEETDKVTDNVKEEYITEIEATISSESY